jgi:dsRNA-specific ribonuclease
MNNLSNKLITKSFIENTINSVSNKNIMVTDTTYYNYLQAFMHKSVLIEYSFSDPEDQMCCFMIDKTLVKDNERLEFLGDSILGAIMKEYIYDNYAFEDEGFLSTLYIKLVKKEHLCYLSECLGFREYILIDCHQEKKGTREKTINLMENVFESFIGALYKSEGFETTRSFVRGILAKFVNFTELIKIDDNYKTKLLMKFHSELLVHPEYTLVEKVGNFNNLFITSVIINKSIVPDTWKFRLEKINANIIKQVKSKYPSHILDKKVFYLALGEGENKKASEQNASKECLAIF